MKSKTSGLIFVFLYLSVFASSFTAQTGKPNSVVNNAEAEKWRQDLFYMAEEMPKYHKNLFHAVTREQFAAAVGRLSEKIPSLARHQIIVEMARIVAMVGDGHTNIAPTRDPKIGFRVFPIKLYFFADGLYVRAATREHADIVGTRVRRIGNVSTEQAYQSVREIIGRDNGMDAKFFAPFLLSMPEVLHALGMINDMEECRFEVEKEGQTKAVTLKPFGQAQMMPPDTDLSWASEPNWIDARETAQQPTPLWLKDSQNKFWFEYLTGSGTVYVQFNQVGNKDNETVEEFSRRLLAFVDSNPVSRLVLDLRLNRGGNGDFARPILRGIIKADKIDQKGKLFTIIGRSTWSAAQFLVNDLEKYTNTILVGEPTGGKPNSFGDSHKITLPNSGITVRVSTLWWQQDERDKRQWTAPELAADLTFEDYRANIDPALKIALNYAGGKTLGLLLTEALSANDPQLAAARYKEWRTAPVNRYANAEEQVNRLGYELIGMKRLDQAIEAFKLNVAAHPQSANVYDSLAEAYLISGNRELAIKNFEKALALEPSMSSAIEALKKLRRE